MIRRQRCLLHCFIALLLSACQVPKPAPTDAELQALRVELLSMQERDQRMEHLVIDQDPAIQEAGFFAEKQTQQDRHAVRCREVFARYGYPGADLVGDEASEAFWLLVQHADRDPQFQEEVAKAMLPVVQAGNARGQHLAYLTDRVRINTGRQQVYGTQTTFDRETGRVRPKPIAEPEHVDERRQQVGLQPLWQYINSSTEMHFRMNQEPLRKLGIAAPRLLPEGYRDW